MAEERWKTTKLWEALKKAEPEGGKVRGLLAGKVGEIEKVLGDTAVKDFTLHDADHAFRVAEWMGKVVGEELLPKLSSYELALLLLSAYLHDVGMSPAVDRVDRHWRHLAYGPGGDMPLSEEEAAALQEFLDEHGDGVEPPLAEDGGLTEEQKALADRLITDYSRFKHNDWSELWMREHLSSAMRGFKGVHS